ncbi:transposase [Limibacter armeniacum]|uniref:IS110 family transposase n=1 Tax=Limibacter armeniacum TaxID=466084 RepID=UPI002FE54E43
MAYQYFIGLDIGKSTMAVLVKGLQSTLVEYGIENTPKALHKLIVLLSKQGVTAKHSLVCMEHSGVYTSHSLEQFYAKGDPIWVENPINIKRSIGMVRGKNDKVDAYRIADFAFRNQDKT